MMSLSSFPSSVSPTRRTVNGYYASTYAATNSVTDNSDAYWNTAAPHFLRAVQASTISNGPETVAVASQFGYDNPLTTGNLTSELRWDSTRAAYNGTWNTPGTLTACASAASTGCNAIQRSWLYTTGGNLQSTTDPNGSSIQITYDTNALYPIQIVNANLRTETHDKFARVIGSTQTTAGNSASPFNFTYSYDLADFLLSVTYPSGRVTNYKRGLPRLLRSLHEEDRPRRRG
jgi:uncharacterized protein RhaS with RHS repeats